MSPSAREGVSYRAVRSGLTARRPETFPLSPVYLGDWSNPTIKG